MDDRDIPGDREKTIVINRGWRGNEPYDETREGDTFWRP